MKCRVEAVTSAFSKSSVFARPHENRKTEFSERSTLESVFEKLRFRDRKRRLRVDANPKRIKKYAFSKRSGYVWTWPKEDQSAEISFRVLHAFSPIFTLFSLTPKDRLHKRQRVLSRTFMAHNNRL